jgi:dipeptidyl-peptidase 4
MKSSGRHPLIGLVFTLLAITSFLFGQRETGISTRVDYARAEQFLGWNLSKLTFNLDPHPVWAANGDLFWYLSVSRQGKQFLLVDPSKNIEQPAFDHARLAASLSSAVGKSYEAAKLPFDEFAFAEEGREIRFDVGENEWNCELATYRCLRVGIAIPSARTAKVSANREWYPNMGSQGQEISPDQRWSAFIRDHNLWVREIGVSPHEVQLTTDGQQHNAYGVEPDASTTAVTDRIRFPESPRICALWSPDSSKLVTYKLDESKMKDSYLIQSVSPGATGVGRPILHTFRFPYPEDKEVATARYVIFDRQTNKKIDTDLPAEEVTNYSALGEGRVWWSQDARTVYAILTLRGALSMALYAIDADTGKARQLLEERDKSELEVAPGNFQPPAVRVIENGKRVIWFSEKDGWGHLYLYDSATGSQINQITRGSWTVRSVEYVDEQNGTIYFTASGREPGEDPYLRHLYKGRVDGSGVQLMTPEDADHEISFSPSGKYFVDTYSRVDTVPRCVLRSVDGAVVREIGKADISDLLAAGWKFPQPFRAKAADGTTDVYGVIFRPSRFDPRRKYPVIDSIYPGPQVIRSPKTMPDTLDGSALALAELGFVVVTVDGRGTPARSRAFHDFSYGHLGDAGGLEDHVSALKELAGRYPYLDITRMGIYGHSGGGFATVRAMLAYPEFYKVGVSSAGDHDLRGYIADWAERYEGEFEDKHYQEASNSVLALNSPLKGKLLLAWGDMDDNVPPASSLQLIDSLIKANSDFDMLLLPNNNHFLSAVNPYFIRRRWDYFVRNLLDKEPPREYELKTAPPHYYSLEAEQNTGIKQSH